VGEGEGGREIETKSDLVSERERESARDKKIEYGINCTMGFVWIDREREGMGMRACEGD